MRRGNEHNDDVPIRVFLLDDHEVVRRGLRELLESEDDMEVVGEAGTAEEAYGRIPATTPNVAVLDVRLPDGDGVEVCREVRSRHPEIACIMLTSFADDDAVYAAIMAGAAGYVLKQVRGTDLVDGIRRVAAGESLLDPSVTTRVLERLRHKDDDDELAALDRPGAQRSSSSSPRASPTARSASACSSPRRRSRTTSRTSSPSSGMSRRTEAAVYAARLAEKRAREGHGE